MDQRAPRRLVGADDSCSRSASLPGPGVVRYKEGRGRAEEEKDEGMVRKYMVYSRVSGRRGGLPKRPQAPRRPVFDIMWRFTIIPGSLCNTVHVVRRARLKAKDRGRSLGWVPRYLSPKTHRTVHSLPRYLGRQSVWDLKMGL